MDDGVDNTRSSYDRVAPEYTRQLFHEFDHKPLDRELLDRFASATAGKGRVCDLGCGPGHLARYLHEHGADAFGIDLSPGMVEQARLASPGIEFQQGDMRALDLPDASLAGIAAFYSIIHIPRDEVTNVLGEFRRVLQPGGLLLVAFHIGDEVIHADEFFGQPVSLDFAFLQPTEMEGYLREAGFEIEETIVRAPYPEVEYQSRRAYIFVRKPAWVDIQVAIGQEGSEHGVIVNEATYRQKAQITIERETSTAPFAITCGIAGWLVHTAYFSNETDARRTSETMKRDLASIVDLLSSENESNRLPVAARLRQFIETY